MDRNSNAAELMANVDPSDAMEAVDLGGLPVPSCSSGLHGAYAGSARAGVAAKAEFDGLLAAPPTGVLLPCSLRGVCRLASLAGRPQW
jgi:hypothetical protein